MSIWSPLCLEFASLVFIDTLSEGSPYTWCSSRWRRGFGVFDGGSWIRIVGSWIRVASWIRRDWSFVDSKWRRSWIRTWGRGQPGGLREIHRRLREVESVESVNHLVIFSLSELFFRVLVPWVFLQVGVFPRKSRCAFYFPHLFLLHRDLWFLVVHLFTPL